MKITKIALIAICSLSVVMFDTSCHKSKVEVGTNLTILKKQRRRILLRMKLKKIRKILLSRLIMPQKI